MDVACQKPKYTLKSRDTLHVTKLNRELNALKLPYGAHHYLDLPVLKFTVNRFKC